MRYCTECGAGLVDEVAQSDVFPGDIIVVRKCPEAKRYAALPDRHHYEIISYIRGKFNPYTGEKNGTQGA